MPVARRGRSRTFVLVGVLVALLMPAVVPGVSAAEPALPVVSAPLASVAEGDAGDVVMHFVLSLDRVSATPVTVDVETTSVSATAPDDFVAMPTTTVTFAPGQTSKIVDVTVHGDTEDEGNYQWFWLSMSNPSGADFGFGNLTSVVEGRIHDDDATLPALPVVSAPLASVAEGDAGDVVMHFVLSLDRVSATPVTVDVETTSVSATAPDDFVAMPTTTVTFAPGQTSKIVDVTVHGDTEDEGNYQWFWLSMSNPSGADFGFGNLTSVVEGRIHDDDATLPALPVVSAPLASVAEGDAGDVVMHFVLSLDRVSAMPVTVEAETFDISATAGDDYDALPTTTVTFAPGQTSKIVDVTVHGDTEDEGSYQYFFLYLHDASGADFGFGSVSATIEGRIHDDDGGDVVPLREVRIGAASVIEGDDGDTRTMHFTVSLDRPATSDVTVDVQSFDSGASAADGDYDAVPLTTLTFTAGQQVKDVAVTTHGDTFDEGDSEAMYVQLSNATNATLAFYVGYAYGYGTIFDDDITPVPLHEVRIGAASVIEGGNGDTRTMHFTVSLDRPAASTVTVDVQSFDSGATAADGDYDAVPLTTLTFTAGQQVKDVAVTTHGDAIDEAESELLYLQLSNPTNATLAFYVGYAYGYGTIFDDEITPVPLPDVRVSLASVIEGDDGDTRTMHFTVSLDRPATSDVTVDIQSFDSGATAADGDYDAVPLTTLTFTAGQQVKDVAVTTHGDTFDEGDSEAMYVQLSNATNATLASYVGYAYGYGTIFDDDLPGPGAIRIPFSSYAVGETDGSVDVSIDRIGGSTGAVSVHYSMANVDATSGQDYTAASGTLTWADGDVSSRTITIPILPDTLLEGPETFSVTLDSPGGGASLTTYEATTVTILDDETDGPPTADAGPTVSGPEGSDIQLDGSASDVETPTPTTLWNATPGVGTDPGATCSFTPPTSTDPTVRCEDDGTYLLTLSVYDGVNTAVTDTTTVTVSNANPTVTIFSPADGSDHALADAVDVAASITDPGSNDTHTCSIDWGDGVAAPGTVLSAQCTGSHTYGAIGPYTIEVTVGDDDAGSGTHSIDITVSDTPPTAPSLTIGDAADGEGDVGTTPLTFTVTLSDPGTEPVTVHWQTHDGSGTAADADYIAASGDLAFQPGDPDEQTVTVNVNGDTTVEPDEFFTVQLSAPVGATIADADGTGTIANDDEVPPCQAVTRTLSNGDPTTVDGAVSVEVDGLGGFGSATDGGDAIFNPVGSRTMSGTVYTSNLYIDAIDAMLSDACNLGVSSEVVSESPSSLVTRTTIGTLKIELTQQVNPIDATGSSFSQTYVITNLAGAPVNLVLVRHVDGDLYFDGTLVDGGAARTDGSVLYEFDQGDNPASPTTFVGISGDLGGDSTPDRWTIQSYPYISPIVGNNGIPAAQDGQVHNDTNADHVVDTPYDVTLSQQWNASIAAAASATFQTSTRFGEAAALPAISVGDISQDEGDVGTTAFSFPVSLSGASAEVVTVHWTTENGSATTADSDYIAASGDLTFSPGGALSQNVTVLVNGDTTVEPTETFTVTLSSPVHATIADGSGQATIVNDDSVVADGPPTADAGVPVSGIEGDVVQLDGTATDTENPTPTILWTADVSGLDPGATCTFDPSASVVDASVACTDDGAITLTLSVDDGVNPPVTDTTTLTLSNAIPQAGIDDPVDGSTYPFGTLIGLSASIGDPGLNDTATCSIDWGDGTTEPGDIDAGLCTGSHDYASEGDYTIIVSATDDDGDDGSSSVAITIGTPEVLLAVDDEATTNETRTITIDVLDNDTGNGTVISATDAAHGSVDCSSAACVYTPDPGFVGDDSFDYTIGDGVTTSTATVLIHVNGCPILGPAIDGGGIVTGQQWVECAGDTAHAATSGRPTFMGLDGATLGLLTSGSAAGTVGVEDDFTSVALDHDVRGANDVSILRLNLAIPAGSTCLSFKVVFGSEEYPEFVGSYNDAFLAEIDATTWTVAGNDITAPANIAFDQDGNVISVNSAFFDADRVHTDSGTTYDGTTELLEVRAPITPGSHQLYLSIFDANDNILDSGVWVDQLVSLNVPVDQCQAGANVGPSADDDQATIIEDSIDNPIDVRDGDSDPDEDSLTIVAVSDPDHGTATIDVPNQRVLYTPDPDYNGPDSFTYTISDGRGKTATATVTIDVLPINDRPTSADGTLVTDLNVAKTIDLGPLANDVETADVNLTFTVTVSPLHGTLSGTGANLTYTPTAGYFGPDSFSFTVTDRGDPDACGAVGVHCTAPLTSDPAGIITITVDGADTSPVADAGPPASGPEGSQIQLDGTATDAENPTPTIVWSYLAGVGVDPGATCAFFPSASVADPTIRCTDDGSYTLTLTVSDGVNPAVQDTTIVTVSNADPVVSITAPLAGASFAAVTDTVNVSASFTDAGANDTQSCSIAWGDASTTVGSILAGVCSGSHVYSVANLGSRTITVTVTDDDLGVGLASVTILVTTNTTPQTDAGPPVSGVEGSQIPLDGTVTDPDPDTLATSWSFTPGASVDAGASCTFTPSATAIDPAVRCTDDGAYTLKLTASDGVNAPVEDTTTLTITNANPVVSISTPLAGSSFAAVTGTVAVSAPFTDAGTNDTQTCSISWGDGSTTAGSIAAGACSGSHVYSVANAGSRTITVTVTDDDLGAGSASVTITITTNTAPQPDAGPSVSGVEGSQISLDGTVTDPDPDLLTTTWSYTTGAGVDAGATCTFTPSATAIDPTIRCTDDGTYTLKLTASDGVNPPVEDTTTLTVSNANPNVSITAPLAGASVGAGVSVTVSAPFTDAGTNDTKTCSIAWGDGATTTGTIAAGACSGSHSYAVASAGSRTITVTVTDDDLGADSATVTIMVVANHAPVVNAGPNRNVNEGSTVSLNGTVSDADTGDTLTYAWTYVPLAGVDAGSTCTFSGPNPIDKNVRCTDDGTYTLMLTVSDGIATASDTLTLNVANRNPSVVIGTATPTANQIFTTNTSVAVSATITDEGANDTHTCAIAWGDGTTTAGVVGALTCTGSHSYVGDGTYDLQTVTIKVTATDDDLGADSKTRNIRIEPCTWRGSNGNDVRDGTSGDDILCGEGGNDTLNGLGGNDILVGQGGNDLLNGGPGNDRFIGLAGDDTATFAGSPASIVADLAAGTASGWGSDVFVQPGLENLIGSANADTLDGDNARNRIDGAAGDDTINGRGGNDDLLGGAGTSDTATFAGAPVGITANLTSGNASGWGGDDLTTFENVAGSSNNDTLIGNTGPNRLSGSDGGDTLDGRGGNDNLRGDNGVDTAEYADSPNPVVVDLNAGTGSGWGNDTLDSIQNVYGSGENDSIAGDENVNRLVGRGGNDNLNGRGAGDDLEGGNGIDRASYAGAPGDVAVNLEAGVSSGAWGPDTLAGIENLRGSSHNDTLRGNSAANDIRGDEGNDTVSGLAGPDVLLGEDGSDKLNGGGDPDQIFGGLGRDILLGEDGSDSLAGDVGTDPTDTGGDPDHINGGAGNDLIYGQGGNDCSTDNTSTCNGRNVINIDSDYVAQLYGGAGKDRIHGGPGTDRLDGGPEDQNTLVGGTGGGDFCSFGPDPKGDTRDLSCELPTGNDRKDVNWEAWDF